MTTANSTTPRPYWPTKGLGAVFDFGQTSNGRASSLLLIISLMLFLPGFFQIPPVDRDEAYFAQATKQMIETGDYVDIRYQDDVRYRKPVGIYWLQAAVVKTAQAVGDSSALTTIWLYRIPSLMGAVGAVLTTYWCAPAFISRRGAILAALMMATSTLLAGEARLAKTDAVLLFTIVTAMAVLARAYLSPREPGNDRLGWKLAAIFWTALAVGILIKGPVNLMVVGLTALTLSIFERSGRWLLALRPLAGVAWLFLIVLPWFVAIYLRVGTAFFVDALGHDMLGKVASAQEAHGAPPGLYFVLFFATFYPGSILAGLAAPAVWRVRREPAAKFLLAWLVPSWIVFELVVTKLPHYVLPLYPAIAILISGAVESKVLSQRPWLVRGAVWWFIAPILISVAVVALAIVVARDPAFPAWPFFSLSMVCGLF
jgi:4-amino-4-deoxy-L-arabinose transferase-like glycosyltransferase